MNRVCFTGIGIVSALGIGREENARSFFEGESGISEVTAFPVGGRSKKAGIIKDFDAERYFNPNLVRRMERYSKLVLTASKIAIESAGIPAADDGKFGSIFSTYWGPLQVTEEFFKKLIAEGPLQAPPMLFPCLVTNASLGRVAKNYQLTGASSYLVGACPLEYSYNFMVNKDMKGVVTGACDELYQSNFASFDAAGYLADNEERDGGMRPLEGKTRGTVLGEGAIVFVLETEEQAGERGVNVLGELLAVSSRFAPVMVNPIENGEATNRFTRNMEQVIERAGVDKTQIGCVISAANSHCDVDRIEAGALARVFGERLADIPVVTPKELFGEIAGAGSSLAAYTALEILAAECLPPATRWLDQWGRFVKKEGGTLEFNGKYIMCNSFIPGSNINSMIIGRGK